MEIKSEIDVMAAISKWMHMYDVPVWWNHKNDAYPTFKTKGAKRSDLLIRYQDNYYIIECKKSDHKKNIYDAFFQILEYAKDCTVYSIDNNTINIEGYVIGTDNSINGRLFDSKHEIILTDFSESRQVAITNEEIPRSEYNMTEAICRLLWRGIPIFNINCSIGVLVSDILNYRDINPLLLMKRGKQQYMKVIK